MACGCGSSKKVAAYMNGTVNFEGKLVARNSIPSGALLLDGVWYYDFNYIPDDVWAVWGKSLTIAYPERTALRTPEKVKEAQENTTKDETKETKEETKNDVEVTETTNIEVQNESKPEVSDKANAVKVTTTNNKQGETKTPKIGD